MVRIIEKEPYAQMTFFTEKRKKPKKVRDDFKAFLTEGARYTEIEQYPIIEDWMVPEVTSIQVIPFNKIKEVPDLENYYICFYCRDKDFKKVLNDPKRYLKILRKAKGIIGFDYSVYDDMPIIKQKAQMFDNLSLTFFYGIRNINVIPNIRYGKDATREEFLNAIPKHSTIAIGSYGCVRSKEEQHSFKVFLEEMLPVLEPKKVAVYGAMPDVVFGDFKDRYTFVRCPAYIDKEMQEVG